MKDNVGAVVGAIIGVIILCIVEPKSYIYFLMNVLDILATVICLLIMHRTECPMFITYKPIA